MRHFNLSLFLFLLLILLYLKTNKPLQIYQQKRLPRDSEAIQTQSLPSSSLSMDDPIPPPIFISSIPDESNLSIALKKGGCNCTHYPLTHYVFLDNLFPTFQCFGRALSSISILNSYQETLNYTTWKAMEEEMHALLNRGRWSLVICL